MISFQSLLHRFKYLFPAHHFSFFIVLSVILHGTLLFSFSLYGGNSSLSRQELFDVDLIAPQKQKVPEIRETSPPASAIQPPNARRQKKTTGTAPIPSIMKDITDKAPVARSDKEATVSLDSAGGKKPSIYDPYVQHLRARINAVWEYPPEAKQRQLGGSLTLRFSISHNGSLIGVQMLRSSGNDILDREALRTIHDAAPFMPLPRSLAIERLNVLASFDYQFAP